MARVTIDTNQLTAPAWAADFLSPDKLIPGGAKVVAASFNSGTPYTITVNDADAARGDIALTVDALGCAIPAGTVLDFGELAADAYTVTLDDAAATAGDTSITVLALPVAMPAGTVLQFSGDTDEIAILSADAAAGATSLTVLKLPFNIVNSGTANYPGTAMQMLAKVTTDAAAGATALVVEPLGGPIVDNATATFYDDADGRKPIASGTVLGRDWSERDGGAGFGPADTTGGDDEIFLAAFDVTDAAVNNDVELVKPGATIYENLLPEWSDLTSALKAQLRSTYVCLKGQV